MRGQRPCELDGDLLFQLCVVAVWLCVAVWLWWLCGWGRCVWWCAVDVCGGCVWLFVIKCGAFVCGAPPPPLPPFGFEFGWRARSLPPPPFGFEFGNSSMNWFGFGFGF